MTTKEMAYSGGMKASEPSVHRIERSTPFFRRGVIIVSLPQFKGLYLYPVSPGTVPPIFQQTVTNTFAASSGTRTRWPVAPGSQVTKTS